MNKKGNLNLYINKSRSEISIDVNAVASYYPGLIKVYVPNVPIQKMLPGWESDKKTTINIGLSEDKTSIESALERSIRRSQKKVVDYLLCNQFSQFVTITFADDRNNIEHSKQKFQTWLKNQRDRNGKFKYVYVPEYHKDSALHFHGVMDGYDGKLRLSRSTKTNRILHGHKGSPRYDLVEFKSGYTRLEYIQQNLDDRARVGNYIRKYITKEMVNIFGKKRYWASQGLNKPIQEDNPQWYMDNLPDEVFENDYGKILTYRKLDNKILPNYVIRLTSENEL